MASLLAMPYEVLEILDGAPMRVSRLMSLGGRRRWAIDMTIVDYEVAGVGLATYMMTRTGARVHKHDKSST